MRAKETYILRLLGGILMLLLTLTACSSDDDSQSEKTVLKIYVYTPDHPIVTRADIGDVSANDAEKNIKSLHVWVFKHDTGDLVGYVTTTENVISSETNNGTLLMDVTDPDFIKNKPNVDVYVMANVTNSNCGLTLNGSKTRTQLNDALIANGKFGPGAIVSSIPNDGLPMSGVLKDQPVFGTAPVFGVGSEDNLAKVKLVRAVSKMRFIFCCSHEDTDDHVVNSITIDKTTFPKNEYLFLNDEYSAVGNPEYPGDERFFPGLRYKVSTTYDTGTTGSLLSSTSTSIPKMQDTSRDPSYYEWKSTQDGTAYEARIAEGLNHDNLVDLHDLGTFYFRESDLQVAGTITYDKINATTYKTADFKISDPGFKKGDFGRNHTWIIFAYFSYAKGLNVVTVKVNDWDDQGDITHEVYNW